MLKSTKNGWALAATAAMLISGCASNSETATATAASQDDMGQCNGANSCKGAGSCASASNACAGQNSCKGKGWIPLSKADCEARGGQFSGFKK